MKSILAAALAVCLCPAVLMAQSSAPAADQAALTQGNNAFAVDLYGQLRTQPGNLFFSPESVSTAFGMAYAGARGQTATQIQHVFHFTLPPERLHPAMGALLKERNGAHPHYELHVADALWAEQDASFLPDYLKLMQDDYGAGLHRVDFEHAPEAVRGTINGWVAQETNNRIQNLIGPGALTPQTRLVLTNAIYFKGSWLAPFLADDTETEDFYLSAKQTVKTPLMHRTGDYYYYDGGSFQALELPYNGSELAMVVLLPKQKDGLPALEKQFTAAAVNTWIDKLELADKVVLTLPRFTMTQQFELSSALSAMGMPLAFSGASDFSGMTGKPDFTISAAIHKAFIEVNEQGTEAAAATGMIMVATAMRGEEPPPIVFRADHPFLFLIRDLQSGEILFMGRLENPAS
ncbi:MAG: serpin family protein [Acidobacteriaceae bacterium]